MASVGGRAASNLSLGQRLACAFREWYIHAAGYRQIGKQLFYVMCKFCSFIFMRITWNYKKKIAFVVKLHKQDLNFLSANLNL